MMSWNCSYLVLVVRLYSYLQLIPFNLTWNVGEKAFSAKSTIIKKLCCSFIHVNGVIAAIPLFISPISQHEKISADLSKVFEVVDNLMSFMLILYMIYFAWKRQSLFMQLLNTIYPFTESARFGTYMIALGFPLTNILYRLVNEALYQSALQQGQSGAHSIINKMADLIISIPSNINDWSLPLRVFYFILKFIATLVHLLLYMFYLFQHAAIIPLLLGLRQTWKAYQAQILRPGLPFEMGVSIYLEIKRCFTLFNELFTIPMLLIYLTNLTTFASLPQYLVCKQCEGLEGPMTRIKIVIDVGYTFFIWLVSSQIHHEIQTSMRAWIFSFHHRQSNCWIGKQSMITREERMKLICFMAEVETDGLGVSCKFFTISYTTFSSMVGLIVTYAIVVYQFTNRQNQVT